ncbi:MAG TPA: GAF domain-containing protein [Symbiobacteriaceae bacterium]|nr:GAF domain-containing protein [Symbiobacteriaceae bacterium]
MRLKLVILVLVAVVPALGLQGWTVYGRYQERVNQELVESRIYAEAVAMAFDNYLNSLYQMELALGNALAFEDHYQSERDAEELLRLQLRANPTIRSIAWLSPDGDVLATTEPAARGLNIGDREQVVRIIAGAETAVSDLITSRAVNVPTISVVRGIRQEGKLAGIVAVALHPDQLGSVLPVVEGAKRRYGLLDRQGAHVYSSDGPLGNMEDRQAVPYAGFLRSLEGEAVYQHQYVSAVDGTKRAGVSMPIRSVNWAYYSTVDLDRVLAGPRATAGREMAILWLTAVASLALAVVMSIRFVGPIQALQAAARAMSAGDLTARVQVQGTDELAAAAQAFDTMAARVQLADEVQRARVTAAAQLSQRSLSDKGVEELAAEAAAVAALSLGTEYAAIMQLLSGEERLSVRASAGWSTQAQGMRIDLESMAGRTLLTREPLVVEDFSRRPDIPRHPTMIKAGIVSAINVLIPGEEQPYGVMAVYATRPRRFSPSDVHFLQTLANVMATAIQRQRAVDDQAFLLRAGEIMAGSLDYETTVASAAKLATSYLSDWCIVDIQEDDGSFRRVEAAAEETEAARLVQEGLRLFPCSPATPGLGQVLVTGHSLLIPRVSAAVLREAFQGEAHARTLKAARCHSAMLVPLRVRDQVTGVITFLSTTSGRRFGQRDLQVAEDLALRASLAIDHARMFGAAQRALQERDRALAETETRRSLLYSLFEHAPSLICMLRGPEHVIAVANPRYLGAFPGRPLLGRKIREAMPELEGQGFHDLLDRVYATGVAYEATEARVLIDRRSDGNLVEGSFNFVYEPMRNGDGEVEGIMIFAVDVTEQVRDRWRVEELASGVRAIARQQEAVARLGQQVIGGAVPAAVMDTATVLAAEVLDADCCEILELASDGFSFTVRSGADWARGRSIPLEHAGVPTQAAYALRQGGAVLLEDVGSEGSFTLAPLLREQGMVSGASVSIHGDERPFGVISVHARQPRQFIEEEIHFLMAVANLVGSAVEQARQEQRRSTGETVTRILAESPCPGTAAAEVARALGEGLGWDAVVLRLADTASGALQRCGQWLAPALVDLEVPIPEALPLPPAGTLMGTIWETREPLWLPDSDSLTDAWWERQGFGQLGLRTALVVPVQLRKEIAGVISLLSRHVRQHETATLRTVAEIGSQFAQFLQRQKVEAELRRLNAELEERVHLRTAELAAANQELEAFAYSVSHDLRAPLRTIDGFSQALLEDCGDSIGEEGRDFLRRIRSATAAMGTLIADLLRLSRVMRSEMHREQVDLSALAQSVADDLVSADRQGRSAIFHIEPDLVVRGDEHLLRVVLENLFANAWKFTSRTPHTEIGFGSRQEGSERVYYIRDNGAGFNMRYADKLFIPFQRLHKSNEFEGTGVGLATVHRIIQRHGGRVWAQGAPGQGAVFSFTLP